MFTNEAKTEVRGAPKYEMTPSPTNVGQLVPPTLVDPVPRSTFISIYVDQTWPKEMEYVEKRIIIEDLDSRTEWFAGAGTGYRLVDQYSRRGRRTSGVGTDDY